MNGSYAGPMRKGVITLSDRKDENLFPAQEPEKQADQTRVMPAVEPDARPPRRRRSDRYEDEATESKAPAEPSAPTESEPEAPKSDAPKPETRVVASQDTVARPAVPRPNALVKAERASAQAAQGQESAATRRPMGTPPGFTPRQPIAFEPRDQERGAPINRSGSGTGPRLPSSVSGNYARRPSPGHGQNPPGQRKKKKTGHKLLIGIVILLLLIGLAIVAAMLRGQNQEGGLLGQARQAVSGVLPGNDETEQVTAATAMASGFTAAIDHGTAPLDVVFNLTTSKSVTQVRLVDEFGTPLDATGIAVTENADGIIWMINFPVSDGFEGVVEAEIYDGTNWIGTGRSQMLEIAMPGPTPTMDVAAFSEVKDEAPETEATAEPEREEQVPEETQVITEEPTEEPTPTPTMALTATPTVASAATPTGVPAAMAATQAPIGEVPVTEQPVQEQETPEPGPAAQQDEGQDGDGGEETTSAPTATPPLKGEAAQSADPALIRDTVIYNGSSKVENYARTRLMNMPVADSYITQPYGVLTYRGNAFRQNAAVGTVEDISEMAVAWTAEAGSVKGSSSTYYGIGWTGQAAIIKWSKEVRAATNIVAAKKDTAALKEVIVAGMDGKIYFLDLADGVPTRDPINLGYPMRGTPSLHPLGYPIMTVGQYARKMASGTGDIGLRFYNLLTQKQDYWIDGLDGKANRPYYGVGAFDTSALIDANSDTLVAIGTNGMLYTATLNTEYSVAEEKVTIKPEVVSMKSRTKGQANKNVAVQSSPAMYGSYVYYADMEGILRCVDTTTMTTVWAVDTDDAVEAAIALDMDESGSLWLYTANTLETRSKGDCSIRRYNALTGEEDWTLAVNLAKLKGDKISGAMASPVIGQYELEDLVYFTLSGVSQKGAEAIFGEGAEAVNGLLLALNKTSGEVVWSYKLDAYSYSSPVAVYDAEGRGWIIQASSSGVMTLLDGVTGEVVDTLEVEGTIDASPAVYNDILVIGTTGKGTSYIYGIKLQ